MRPSKLELQLPSPDIPNAHCALAVAGDHLMEDAIVECANNGRKVCTAGLCLDVHRKHVHTARAHHQCRPVLVKGHASKPILRLVLGLIREGLDAPVVANVPHFDHLVNRHGDKLLPLVHQHVKDRGIVPLQRGDRSLCIGVPDNDLPVQSARRKPLVDAAPTPRMNALFVETNGIAPLLPPVYVQVTQIDLPIEAACDHGLQLRHKTDFGYPIVMVVLACFCLEPQVPAALDLGLLVCPVLGVLPRCLRL
mmetsp:Transcript_48743/g.112971  ORF Transcript_48743/g.112971 Transcript_48743/m.112971 type:complete len:251 (+) Transcript_48743:1562-2314(+)